MVLFVCSLLTVCTVVAVTSERPEAELKTEQVIQVKLLQLEATINT